MKMIFTFLIVCFLKVIYCADFNDGDIYNVSLKGLNPMSENSEVYFSQNVLYQNSTITVSITDISPSFGFLITQSHSYKYNLTISYETNLNSNHHIDGTNIGLVIKNSSSELFKITNYGSDNVTFYFSIHAYDKNAPVPGGCGTKLDVIDAPFMELWHDDHIVRVNASQARVSTNDICEVNSTKVTYEFYKMFLSEWDRSEEEYFDGLKKMLTVKNILKYGSHAPRLSRYALMSRYFSLYAGTGSFYVIIAKTGNVSSAYIPVHTYGCDDCKASWHDYLFLALITIVGVSLSFFSTALIEHQFYIYGVILVTMCSYILTNFITISALATLSFCGVSVVVYVISHFISESCNMSMPAMFILGFQIACICCQAIPGDVLASESYFWLILIGVTLIVTVLPFFDFGYKIACSVVGSFCITILFDSLAGSYLRYIVINVFRRMSVTDFSVANIEPPYQWRDIAVSVVWIVLNVLCILISCNQGKGGRTPREPREPRDPRDSRMPRFPRKPRTPRTPRSPRTPRTPRTPRN